MESVILTMQDRGPNANGEVSTTFQGAWSEALRSQR